MLAALSAVISLPPNEISDLVTPVPTTAVVSGAKLVVGKDQLAALVGKDGRALDAFGPGEHIITRETAPRAAAASRSPAPGFSKSVIKGTPVFASTRETSLTVERTARARSGEAVAARGNITFSIASLPEFVAPLGPLPRGLPSSDGQLIVQKIFGPAIDQAITSHDAQELSSKASLVEAAIRSSAQTAGLRVVKVALTAVGPLSANDRMAALQERQREALSHMPPEMQAQMAQAMARAQTARAGHPGAATPAGPVPSATAAAPATGALRNCPACNAPNPSGVKFCGSCGKPLPASRTCPKCGSEVAPSIKFCGNCGSALA